MQKLSVNFNAAGLIESVVVDGVTVIMSQNLMWYAGMNEGNANSIFDDRPSGAYVFRPNGTDATPFSTQATLIVQTGSYMYLFINNAVKHEKRGISERGRALHVLLNR